MAPVRWGAADLVVAGTGYTGEDGVEWRCRPRPAAALWTPCWPPASSRPASGARDTLRLEAGLPLHGHELGPGITPLQAGLGWVVRWDKGDVPGPRRRCWPRRSGASPVASGAWPSRVAGRPGPTSRCCATAGRWAWSPAATSRPELGHGIALAFVPPDVEIGDDLAIDVRGTEVPAEVVKLPFVARG